jgi:transposase
MQANSETRTDSQPACPDTHRPALYFAGRQLAGENMADVLKQGVAEPGPAIQMSAALRWNVAVHRKNWARCTVSMRRRTTRAWRRRSGYASISSTVSNPGGAARLAGSEFTGRKVEPNSGLGKAITYLLRHWKALTLLLRQGGAPLDDGLCERALKIGGPAPQERVVLSNPERDEAGDLFISLIHTCELCGANSFGYLTEWQRHAQELAACPAEWMPWNYRGTLNKRMILRLDE